MDLLARRAQGPLLISRRSVRAGHPHAQRLTRAVLRLACRQHQRALGTAAGLGALATPRSAA